MTKMELNASHGKSKLKLLTGQVNLLTIYIASSVSFSDIFFVHYYYTYFFYKKEKRKRALVLIYKLYIVIVYVI